MAQSLKDTINAYNKKADKTSTDLQINPFSDEYKKPVHKLTDDRYGRPTQGSKTEKRGIKAGNYVYREILFLCEIIEKFSKKQSNEGKSQITFGELFAIYQHYSDKVVGMLLRARKYKLVDFEGEMLYQRQDDHKIITLHYPLAEIQKVAQTSNDPQHCFAFLTAQPSDSGTSGSSQQK